MHAQQFCSQQKALGPQRLFGTHLFKVPFSETLSASPDRGTLKVKYLGSHMTLAKKGRKEASKKKEKKNWEKFCSY